MTLTLLLLLLLLCDDHITCHLYGATIGLCVTLCVLN